MTKMVITNIKFFNFDFINLKMATHSIRNCLVDKIKKNGILAHSRIDEKTGTVTFEIIPDMKPKRLFLSEKQNKIALKPDGALAKKLGRDYAMTHRLSQRQSDVMWNEIINGTLNKLGVSCTIQLEEFKEGSEGGSITVVREGMDWKDFPSDEDKTPTEVA